MKSDMVVTYNAVRYLAAALLATCLAHAANAASVPTGIYAFSGLDSQLKVAIYQNPSVTGVTLNSTWSNLEPNQGQFHWTDLDKQVAQATQAGRQIALSVTPGAFSPKWLYSAGAAKFGFRWYLSWGFPLCSSASIPLPWDPVYLNAWTSFIRALAAHYAGNPAVTVIKLTGINAQSAETLLPYTSAGHIVGGSLCGAAPIAPVSAWQAVGYRASKIASAWNTIVAAFAAAFPNQQLMMETGPWGFPPIDANGNLIVGSAGDLALGPMLMTAGAQVIGARFALENNGLSTGWVFPMPAAVPAGTPMAFQTAWRITGDATCQVNNFITPCDPATVTTIALANANAASAEMVEMYVVDILNPVLAGPIATFGN